jgi:hypothetical protein
MEYKMSTVIGWIAAALFVGLVWLVAGYTVEYFRPYKKIRMNRKKK